jgi:serine/threonine protein kinase
MSESSGVERGSEKMQRIGDYRVIAELARGGMGRVYLARRSGQAGFERLFAIKVMHDRLSDDPEARLMLLDEAHIASRLHHPNVVSVVDVGRYSGGHYLVMDYVEGCTLKQLLDRTPGYRPPRLIIPVMLDALRGLHAAHSLRNAHDEPYQVVHRDVSPDNLLLGLDGCCRVTDFGVAKARERLTDTQVGVCKGKIAFMAPEQLEDAASVDQRVDVWAAGVTLYAALTGEHPFRARPDGSILHSILKDPVAPPSTVGVLPPAALDAVVLRALERDPAQRYPDAQAFADALREVAMSHDLLGSSADVAQWVETACGYRLAQRRRSIAELSSYECESTMLASQPVPSAPPPAHVGPHRKTSAAVVLCAMLIGGVMGWFSEDEAQARSELSASTAIGASAAPRSARAQALRPTVVLNSEPSMQAVTKSDAMDAQTPALSDHGAHEHPSVGTARSASESPDERVLDAQPADEPAAVPEAEQPETQPLQMEQNPYLHGR